MWGAGSGGDVGEIVEQVEKAVAWWCKKEYTWTNSIVVVEKVIELQWRKENT